MKEIIKKALKKTFDILNSKKDGLKRVAEAISERKTKDEINEILVEVVETEESVQSSDDNNSDSDDDNTNDNVEI